MSRRKRLGVSGAVVLAVIGSAFAAVGWFLLRPETIPHAAVTTGSVVELLTDNKGLSRPRIAFRVGDRIYEHVDQVASSSPPSVGEAVEVEYDTSDPNRARWTGSSATWMWMIFGGLGLVLIVAGLGALVRGILRLGTAGALVVGGAGAAMGLARSGGGSGRSAPVVPPPPPPGAPLTAPGSQPGDLPAARPPAGWNPSQEGHGERRWDGHGWSEHPR